MMTTLLAALLALALVGCAQNRAQQEAAEGQQAEQAAEAEQAETPAAEEPAEEAPAPEFPSWVEGSEPLAKLVAYVEDVTDESSPNFIPPEDRIVVSDFDGTLFGELNPTYFDWALSVHRVLYDSSYEPTPEQVAIALEIEETERTGVYQKDGMEKQARMAAGAYGGMTPDELWDYAIAFGQEASPRFTNLNRDEAYYAPMLEVVDYLIANDFTFYVVTGSDRTVIRAIVDGMIDIPPSQIIGSDNTMVATGQGDEEGLYYTWEGSDELIFGGEAIIKDLKMNKVTAIAREIGVQPVIALGNSTSDAAMLNYALANSEYEPLALFVLADDVEREYGNPEKAAESRKLCEEQGWVPVSMADDWTTIYGAGVERDESWTWDHPDRTGANARETSYAEGQMAEAA